MVMSEETARIAIAVTQAVANNRENLTEDQLDLFMVNLQMYRMYKKALMDMIRKPEETDFPADLATIIIGLIHDCIDLENILVEKLMKGRAD